MQVTNKKTRKDVSGLFLQLMEGKITNEEFEELAEIPEADRMKNRVHKLVDEGFAETRRTGEELKEAISKLK